MLFADVSVRKTSGSGGKGNDEDDDVDEGEVSCMKWIASDHPRPCVHLQESPYFPGIILSVSDWNFHIWKVRKKSLAFFDCYTTLVILHDEYFSLVHLKLFLLPLSL